jgi:hypothetical protein
LLTGDETRRGLRDSPLGKAALFLGVLLAAFLVARTCGSTAPDVSQERAIEIAKAEIDFEPTAVQVRNVPRGIQGERAWVVSLYTGKATNPGRCRLVEIDADSGRVDSVRKC